MKHIVPAEHDPILLEAYKRLSVRFCLIKLMVCRIDEFDRPDFVSKLQEIVLLSEKSAEVADSRLERLVIQLRDVDRHNHQ